MKLKLQKYKGRDVFVLEDVGDDLSRIMELRDMFEERKMRLIPLRKSGRVIIDVEGFDMSRVPEYVRDISRIVKAAGLEIGDIDVEGYSAEQVRNMIETVPEREAEKVEEELSKSMREVLQEKVSEVRKRLGSSLLETVMSIDLCSIPSTVYAVFGVASIGKTRLCVRLAYELSLLDYDPMFIVSEANWKFGERNMYSIVRDLMPNAEIIDAFNIRELTMNVLKTLSGMDERLVIVYDSFGATAHAVGEQILQREIEKAMELEKMGEEAEVKIEPAQISARAIPLLNILTRFLATYASRTGSIVICIAHESQTVMRKWHGYTVKPSFGERSLHYMYAVYRLAKIENTRRLTCIVHREKPDMEGRSVTVHRQHLDLESLIKK